MNRLASMITVIMLAAALFFGGLAAYATFRQDAAVALEDCKSLQTILQEETVARDRHFKDSAAWLHADNRVKDVGEALKVAGCTSAEAEPTLTPEATPSERPAPGNSYACRSTFYNERSGKSGLYAFGAPVSQTGVDAVTQELKDRTWCDPALLVETLHQFRAGGMENLNDYELWQTANQLVESASNGSHDEWNRLHAQLTEALGSATLSLDSLPTGRYLSRQMIADDAGRAPRVENILINRKVEWDVLTVTLGSGQVVMLRLECGFQAQTPRDKAPRESRTLREDIPRNEEGTPAKPTPKPKPMPPITEPSPTPKPSTKPTPKPTPTTESSLEPKSSNPEDYKHETGAPKAKVTTPAQAKPEPVVTKKPGGGGVIDTPTKAPGSESGITAPGASKAPTSAPTAQQPPEAGANTPTPGATSCVPAPGKSGC